MDFRRGQRVIGIRSVVNCQLSVLGTAVLIPMLCLGQSLPGSYEFRLLGRVGLAAAQLPLQENALRFLEHIAEGKPLGIAPGSAAEVGLTSDEIQKLEPGLHYPSVRAHALLVLGQTGLPQALEYLRNFKESDVGVDTSYQVWPASQIALREAQLAGIADPQQRIEFLESTLGELYRIPASGEVVGWAEDQLCNSGNMPSLPLIRASILRHESSAEDDIQFCEAQSAHSRAVQTERRRLGVSLPSALQIRD